MPLPVKEASLALKPTGLTMEEAASMPLVALTAWQALEWQDVGRPWSQALKTW